MLEYPLDGEPSLLGDNFVKPLLLFFYFFQLVYFDLESFRFAAFCWIGSTVNLYF